MTDLIKKRPKATASQRVSYLPALLAIILVLVVPMLFMLGVLAVRLHTEYVVNAKEHKGIVALAPLLLVYIDLERRRAGRDASPAAVAHDIAAADAAIAETGPALGFDGTWKRVRARLHFPPQGDLPDGDMVRGSVLDLIHAADTASGLSLDPEVPTYYLGDIAANKFPEATDAGSNATVLIGAATAGNTLAPVARDQIYQHLALYTRAWDEILQEFDLAQITLADATPLRRALAAATTVSRKRQYLWQRAAAPGSTPASVDVARSPPFQFRLRPPNRT